MIWCLLSGQSLILWAETQGGPLFASPESAGFPGFPPAWADSRGCWLYILIPLFPFLHPFLPPASCLRPAGPAAVPPQRHSRPPRPCRNGQWRPFVVETRGVASVGEWCWWRFSGADFFLKMLWTRQQREGMIICDQILKYRGLLLLCVARWFYIIRLLYKKGKKKKKDPEAIMGGKGFLEKPLSFTAIK